MGIKMMCYVSTKINSSKRRDQSSRLKDLEIDIMLRMEIIVHLWEKWILHFNHVEAGEYEEHTSTYMHTLPKEQCMKTDYDDCVWWLALQPCAFKGQDDSKTGTDLALPVHKPNFSHFLVNHVY